MPIVSSMTTVEGLSKEGSDTIPKSILMMCEGDAAQLCHAMYGGTERMTGAFCPFRGIMLIVTEGSQKLLC